MACLDFTVKYSSMSMVLCFLDLRANPVWDMQRSPQLPKVLPHVMDYWSAFPLKRDTITYLTNAQTVEIGKLLFPIKEAIHFLLEESQHMDRKTMSGAAEAVSIKLRGWLEGLPKELADVTQSAPPVYEMM